MGWASANAIFDGTAHALIDAKTEPHIITDVLAVLIEQLTDADWDTLDESIEDFRDVEPVMEAFRRAAPDWMDGGDGVVDHFVSASCRGETCTMCREPATHKVGEEIFHDDPNPYRHNLTAYVCCDHFGRIMQVVCEDVSSSPPIDRPA